MIGAVLHTVNVRLSPEQILYTINHAEDDILLVHADFLPILEAIQDSSSQRRRSCSWPTMTNGPNLARDPRWRVRASARVRLREFDFPDLDENTRATTFYTTGTTGPPKGCPSAIGSWCCTRWPASRPWARHQLANGFSVRCVHADHADVPRACVGAAVHRYRHGRQAGLSRTLRPGRAARRSSSGGRNLLPLRADDPAHAPEQPGKRRMWI